MKRSKTPAILIGVGLLLLILLPVVFLLLPERGGGGLGPASEPPRRVSGGAVVGETPLEALAREARNLVNDRMVDAAARKVLPLDQLQRFQSELDRADDALRRGRESTAKERYERILSEGGAVLGQLDAADRWQERSRAVSRRLAAAEVAREVRPALFEDARRQFDGAVRQAYGGDPAGAITVLGRVEATLDELEELASVRLESLLTRAHHALERFDLATAREAVGEALRLQPGNRDALALDELVSALDGISDEVRAIRGLIDSGNLDTANSRLSQLVRNHPNNPVVAELARELKRLRTEQSISRLLETAERAEREGRLGDAIAALEAAIDLRADEALLQRLSGLIERREAVRLAALLTDGFEALRLADYRKARDLYREALAVRPDSDEARQGLERSARLLIAEVEFRENLESAHRMAREGRFPMAATFFNRAMSTRPSNLPETDRERSLRTELERQSVRVPVTIRSDNRTFVSIIGVFSPEQFRSKEVELFPDVYRVRGTRRGENGVELEVKVNAETGAAEITVIAGAR